MEVCGRRLHQRHQRRRDAHAAEIGLDRLVGAVVDVHFEGLAGQPLFLDQRLPGARTAVGALLRRDAIGALDTDLRLVDDDLMHTHMRGERRQPLGTGRQDQRAGRCAVGIIGIRLAQAWRGSRPRTGLCRSAAGLNSVRVTDTSILRSRNMAPMAMAASIDPPPELMNSGSRRLPSPANNFLNATGVVSTISPSAEIHSAQSGSQPGCALRTTRKVIGCIFLKTECTSLRLGLAASASEDSPATAPRWPAAKGRT